MSNKIIQGSYKLGVAIRKRRQELELTLEDASKKAGVSLKSWCRYEAGGSIRQDKAKGICHVLGWKTLAIANDFDDMTFDLSEYKEHEAWSRYLCEQFGEVAAISFVIGSDILLDKIQYDFDELSKMSKGSHLGQLSFSSLKDELPEQFLTYYDYEFLYQMKSIVLRFREKANKGKEIIAHTVLEELVIYMFMEESLCLMECMIEDMRECGIEDLDIVESWTFDLFGDMDIITFLYSDIYLTNECVYHFDNWSKPQFYINE
jgi:transcriptional regulator with XRE-family HTH domain